MLWLWWRRIVLLLGAVLLTAAVVVACGGGKETRPDSLVPEGSTLVGQVLVAEALEELDLAPLYDALPKDQDDPQTFDGLLDEASMRTGVDLRNVSRATFFADLSRAGGYAGVIVHGGFDEDAVVAAVEKESGVRLAASAYKGRVVHAAEGEEGAPALAVIEGDNLVLGTLEAVHSVIDVQDGDRDPASGGA